MHFNPIAALAAASLASAATPSGFRPSSGTELYVQYRSTSAINGASVAQNTTQLQPQIGTASELKGQSYAIIMVDIDATVGNNNNNSANNGGAFLHWMQTNLSPSNNQTKFNSSSNSVNVYTLRNSSSNTSPYASYIAPNPPPRNPSSHRYVQILVDTSDANDTALQTLRNAARNRIGFNTLNILTIAGLDNKVVAGNYFNVTNSNSVTAGTPALAAQGLMAVAVGAVGAVLVMTL